MPSIRDIPKLTNWGNYDAELELAYLNDSIERYVEKYHLNLKPDFQRGHVWTEKQQIKFLEFLLRGGRTTPILFNHPNWMSSFKGEMVCVDGLQRITAMQRFLDDKFKVFGHFCSEYTDLHTVNNIPLRINNLKTRAEILRWYLELNSGGTPHSKEEIERVEGLLDAETI